MSLDLSRYIAVNTVNTVKERVGGKVSFRDRAFELDPQNETGFYSWNHFRIRVYDEGAAVRFVIDRKAVDVEDLRYRIHPELKGRDREVFDSVEVEVLSDEEVEVEAHFTKQQNSSGRVQNEKRLYHALYRSVIRPIIIATAQIGLK
jgi:hypothetical protein